MLYSEKIQYFIELVRHGSFSRSAKHLNVATSTVTKAITNLEKELGKTLVKRLKSGVELTPVGQDLYESVIEPYLNIEHKFNLIQNKGVRQRSSLKIITTTGVVSLWILPRLKAFQEKYPNVTLRIETTNGPFSFTNTDADVAIFSKIDNAGAIIKKKLLTVHFRLFASQEYLDHFGTPQSIADLKNHRLIGYYLDKNGYVGNVDWVLNTDELDLKPYFVMNSAIGQYYAAKLGYGILTIAKELPFLDGNLIEILPDLQGAEIDVFFITRKKQLDDHLTNALYNSLMERKIN